MKSFGTLIAAFFVFSTSLQAQKAGPTETSGETAKTFRLDPRRPFVYLRFDHMGEGTRLSEREPSTRIWLRLVNDCRIAIVVPGGERVGGGLPGEALIHNVVRLNQRGVEISSCEAEPDLSPVPTTLAEPGQSPKRSSQDKSRFANSKPQSRPAVTDDETFMPIGYPSSDVVSTETIAPGADVLFSVPVNLESRKWHFEISFDLDSERRSESIPERSAFVNPYVRGRVELTLSYGFYDLPKEGQEEVDKLNRAQQQRQ